MTIHLTITADDLGIDPARDRGILLAFSRGVVTQASVLVNGPSAREAIAEARAVGLPLGLHLNLTEGRPLAPPGQIASLVGPGGELLGKHGLREAFAAARIDPEHVLAEVRAQLERFATWVGSPPAHVDGHQHVHVLPDVAGPAAGALRAAGVVSVRIPEEPAYPHAPERPRFYALVVEQAAAARATYAGRSLRATHRFVGLDLMGARASREGLMRALLAARDSIGSGGGSIEYMCHPGLRCEGWDAFNESPERTTELALLTSPSLRAALETSDVRLLSMADLAARGLLR